MTKYILFISLFFAYNCKKSSANQITGSYTCIYGGSGSPVNFTFTGDSVKTETPDHSKTSKVTYPTQGSIEIEGYGFFLLFKESETRFALRVSEQPNPDDILCGPLLSPEEFTKLYKKIEKELFDQM
jgi:hypothetical protein